MGISKGRNGKPADIARLDFHGWAGQLQERIKGSTNEKDIGVAMIMRIKDRFNLTESEIREIEKRILYADLYQPKKELLFSNKNNNLIRDFSSTI